MIFFFTDCNPSPCPEGTLGPHINITSEFKITNPTAQILLSTDMANINFCDFASGIFGNCGDSVTGDEILLDCIQDIHPDYNAPDD